jgi:hypothetical protein
MTLDEAREFYAFLQGGPPPEGFTLRGRPRLSRSAAFSVLYVLQERYHVIPDTFEQCVICHELFDISESGTYDESGKHYCDTCLPSPTREAT